MDKDALKTTIIIIGAGLFISFLIIKWIDFTFDKLPDVLVFVPILLIIAIGIYYAAKEENK